MGKYIVTASGTDRKSEIISCTYYLPEYSDAVEYACKSLLEEDYSSYEPYNIEVSVIDVEAAYKSFKVSENDFRRVDAIIYRKQREASEKRQAEIELLKQLKAKYPEE